MYIKVAAGVAVFSAVLTAIAMGKGLFGANRWALIDVAILLGLAYGVFRGSVASAITLFGYHVANRVYLYQTAGVKPSTSAFMYGAMYLLGALGAASLPRPTKVVPDGPSASGGQANQ
jgi:hypothetical protein